MDILAKQNIDLAFFAVSAAAAWFAYIVYLAIYRLYLHPLADFPGPKLAALSKWYEFYYEVVLVGQFTFHIQELHKKYGPIVRITPDEIHIRDADYYDELYAKSGRMDKYDWMSGRFGNEGSLFTTAPDELHRIRRGALNPMFSKKKIIDFQPIIRSKLDKLVRALTTLSASGRPVVLSKAWGAYAGDIITEYAFSQSYNHLDVPDFEVTLQETVLSSAAVGHTTLQFPFLNPLMRSLPESWVTTLEPKIALTIQMQNDLDRQITAIKNGENEAVKHATHPTIFHELLENKDIPASERADARMRDEAQLIVAAGLMTVAWALSVTSYHIIRDPAIFAKLRAELVTAMPDATAPLDWLKLERLPYLTACIKEGIRLSYGVTARNPRLSNKSLRYGDRVIPPRTPVSMTIVDMNHDESVFPDSFTFVPERWLGEPKTAKGVPLERYFVGFGKGSRSCLGINLAWAELYMGLAAVFRRFTFELYETDDSDVRLAHDLFLPDVKKDSKGVRVTVKSVDA